MLSEGSRWTARGRGLRMRVACEIANIRHSNRGAVDVGLNLSISVTEMIPNFSDSVVRKLQMRLKPEPPRPRYSVYYKYKDFLLEGVSCPNMPWLPELPPKEIASTHLIYPHASLSRPDSILPPWQSDHYEGKMRICPPSKISPPWRAVRFRPCDHTCS